MKHENIEVQLRKTAWITGTVTLEAEDNAALLDKLSRLTLADLKDPHLRSMEDVANPDEAAGEDGYYLLSDHPFTASENGGARIKPPYIVTILDRVEDSTSDSGECTFIKDVVITDNYLSEIAAQLTAIGKPAMRPDGMQRAYAVSAWQDGCPYTFYPFDGYSNCALSFTVRPVQYP